MKRLILALVLVASVTGCTADDFLDAMTALTDNYQPTLHCSPAGHHDFECQSY